MHKLGSMVALLVGAAALALPTAAGAQQKITIGIPTSPPNIVHMQRDRPACAPDKIAGMGGYDQPCLLIWHTQLLFRAGLLN